MAKAVTTSPEWVPETAVREILLGVASNHGDAAGPLFWINLRRYVAHEHFALAPRAWFQHWRCIYEACREQGTSTLQDLPYVSTSNPYPGGEETRQPELWAPLLVSEDNAN